MRAPNSRAASSTGGNTHCKVEPLDNIADVGCHHALEGKSGLLVSHAVASDHPRWARQDLSDQGQARADAVKEALTAFDKWHCDKGWVARVYTAEQQQRLGVDENMAMLGETNHHHPSACKG